ncbi:MAG: hypothetical protein GXY98_00165 [Erysipelothrix sp.]|nr:hypothetical protein [Erysipelothrix sp.]
MKRILNIMTLKSQEDVDRLDEVLRETRLDYRIKLEESVLVLMDGSSDMVRIARLAIEKAGFQVL